MGSVLHHKVEPIKGNLQIEKWHAYFYDVLRWFRVKRDGRADGSSSGTRRLRSNTMCHLSG
jgi:hypothetical protein